MTKLTYTMFISFICNTFLAVLKILAGVIGRSSSLIADGIHTFSDSSTDLISIKEDGNDKGHLFNFIVGFLILGLGLSIIYLSITKTYTIPSIWLVIISLLTIILKYILSSYVMEKGLLYNNMILIKNARESDNDVISSVIVFLGLVLMQLSDVLLIFKYTDMVASIIVALFVIKSGFDVLSHEINGLFGTRVEDSSLLSKIKEDILKNDKVLKINHIEMMSYGPYNELKVDIVLDSTLSLKGANILTHNIESKLRKQYPEIEYIIMKIDPSDID